MSQHDIRERLSSNDIEKVKQGLVLLRGLIKSAEDLRLYIEYPQDCTDLDLFSTFLEKQNWQHHNYIKVWMLGFLATCETSWVLNIRELNLHGSNLTELPSNLSNLKDLKELNISNNALITLPTFPNLEKLIAHQNQIKMIPATICQCHNLTELWLGFNPIQDIPNEIGDLSRLRHLSLSDTLVTSIQWEEGQFKGLEELLLDATSIANPPQRIQKQLSIFLPSVVNDFKVPSTVQEISDILHAETMSIETYQKAEELYNPELKRHLLLWMSLREDNTTRLFYKSQDMYKIIVDFNQKPNDLHEQVFHYLLEEGVCVHVVNRYNKFFGALTQFADRSSHLVGLLGMLTQGIWDSAQLDLNITNAEGDDFETDAICRIDLSSKSIGKATSDATGDWQWYGGFIGDYNGFNTYEISFDNYVVSSSFLLAYLLTRNIQTSNLPKQVVEWEGGPPQDWKLIHCKWLSFFLDNPQFIDGTTWSPNFNWKPALVSYFGADIVQRASNWNVNHTM